MNIFVKRFFHSFISHKCAFRCSAKYIFLKIPKDSQEITFTRLSWLRHRYFSENFLKVLGTPFLQNTSERLLLISIPSSYCFKTFLFQSRSIFFLIFRAILGYLPLAHWAPILFLHRINAIEVNMTPVLKTFMVFISWSILTISPKCSGVLKKIVVLNMSGFWIYQGHEHASGYEYARVLNKPGFWIYQDSAYALVLNLPGFWICQGYTGFWICQSYTGFWICLNLPDYV